MRAPTGFRKTTGNRPKLGPIPTDLVVFPLHAESAPTPFDRAVNERHAGTVLGLNRRKTPDTVRVWAGLGIAASRHSDALSRHHRNGSPQAAQNFPARPSPSRRSDSQARVPARNLRSLFGRSFTKGSRSWPLSCQRFTRRCCGCEGSPWSAASKPGLAPVVG